MRAQVLLAEPVSYPGAGTSAQSNPGGGIKWGRREGNRGKAKPGRMFAQLEGVIAEMEKDGISLEHSFDLYNKGMGPFKRVQQIHR